MPVLLSSGSHSNDLNYPLIFSSASPALSSLSFNFLPEHDKRCSISPSRHGLLPLLLLFTSLCERANRLPSARVSRTVCVIRPNTSTQAFRSRFLFTPHATSVAVSHASVDVQLQETYYVFVNHSQSELHRVNNVLCFCFSL